MLDLEAYKFIGLGALAGLAVGLVALVIGGPEGHTREFMQIAVRTVAVATLGGAFIGLFVARVFSRI